MEPAWIKNFSCTPGDINAHLNVGEGWILRPFFSRTTVNEGHHAETQNSLCKYYRKLMKFYLEAVACIEDVGACLVVNVLVWVVLSVKLDNSFVFGMTSGPCSKSWVRQLWPRLLSGTDLILVLPFWAPPGNPTNHWKNQKYFLKYSEF